MVGPAFTLAYDARSLPITPLARYRAFFAAGSRSTSTSRGAFEMSMRSRWVRSTLAAARNGCLPEASLSVACGLAP